MDRSRWVVGTSLLVLVAGMLSGASGSAGNAAADDDAPVLPPGFVLREQQIGQSAGDLTDVGYLPDGSVLSTGKQGGVVWAPQTGGTPRTIATLPVDPTQDLGLIGLSITPDYATSHRIYLARSLPNPGGTTSLRLAGWTVTTDAAGDPTGLTGEQPVFELPADHTVHALSGVVAAPDGTVWASLGDNSDYRKTDPTALRAQDRNAMQGKILHLNADGTGASDNPYYDATAPNAARSRIYASGFRSPFRFSLDPASGQPVVADVGWNTWEEVDVVQRGANYGWPCWEGRHRTSGYSELAGCANVVNTEPVWEYHHGGGTDQGNSITGGLVYQGTSYPQAYRGAYFFGDYTTNKIWTMRYDDRGVLTQAPQSPPFGTGIGAPVKFGAAANGDIIYADIASGTLKRLSYSTGNTTPVAKATSSTDPDTRTVTFDAGQSVDFDGDPLSYAWNFGDGTTGTGAHPSHSYPAGVERATATLTVRDPLGATDTTTLAVAPANHSPELQLSTPGNHTFAVDEPVAVSATATDAEDGPLTVTWTSAVLHCPERATCHQHPEQSGTGADFGMPFTDHPDSRLKLTATVTDSAGVSASGTYVAMPRQHRLTLDSDIPAALQIPVEGGVSSALVTEGATFEVIAAPTATDGASTFAGWTDGEANRTRTLTVGTTDRTLSAHYRSPIEQRYAGEPALRQLLGTPTGPEVLDGGTRYRTYTGGRLYWSSAGGTHEVHGAILAAYLNLGGHQRLGPPSTDQRTTPGSTGRYNHFTGTPATLTASIYWTQQTGAHAVWGKIRELWRTLNWERGRLGFPKTDELTTRDRTGRYNHFSKNGSIFWTATTGAHEVYGAIRQRWSALGWERSYLGYPSSGEFAIPGGRRNNFQHGYIVAKGGTVTDRRG